MAALAAMQFHFMPSLPPCHQSLMLLQPFPMSALALIRLAAALLLLPGAAEARNPSPFSSNVVALTPRNWKREVEDSPHGVFVNICRSG